LAAFAVALESALSSSAVYECPQVLHLHFAFGLAILPSIGLLRPLSLGRKVITRSPPHSIHCLFIMIYYYSKFEQFSGHN
jgi:hypothetical protein